MPVARPRNTSWRARMDARKGEEVVAQAASSPPGESPALSALKDVWVTYAESKGIDTAGLTKTQIIEAVGGS